MALWTQRTEEPCVSFGQGLADPGDSHVRGVVAAICSPFSRAVGAAGLAEGPAPALGGAWAPGSCRSGSLRALGCTVQTFPDTVLAPTKVSL